MTVSIDATTKKYHGKKAATYEKIRVKQQRWDVENASVKRMIRKLKPRSVLDVPCGTGRFLGTYDVAGVKRVMAVDVSDEMLAQAQEKLVIQSVVVFKQKDIRDLVMDSVDVSVCVRFLDLIDDIAMRQVMKKLMEVSRRGIICTIRLGPKYVAKSNTATHDEQKFHALLKKHGWKIAKDVPIFTQGWHVFLLKRRTK